MSVSVSISLGFPPFARFFHAERLPFGDHRGNANLIFSTILRVSAGDAGIYSRSDVRRREPRRAPVDSNVSSDEDRNV